MNYLKPHFGGGLEILCSMDPLFEQRLRDEVIYLHSLWHQGPPRPTGVAAAAATRHHLPALQATQFKKQKIPERTTTITAFEFNSSPATEWPCPAPSPSTTGWPCVKPQTNPPLSAEEEWNLAGLHAQKKALSVVREFFTSKDADDSDAIDSSSDDDDELMEQDDESDAYGFFSKVFTEDTKLREYYEKSFANGEFSCLVCGAFRGKKTSKKFKGCLPLVQHSMSISSKKRAHRAFGGAACKVLGWELDHLPAIVSMLSDKSDEGKCGGENQDSSSMALVKNFNSVNNDPLDGKNDEAVPENACVGSGISPHGEEGDTNSAVKSLEDCTKVQTLAPDGLTISTLTSPDDDKNLENLGVVCRHNVEEPASEGLKIGNSSSDNKEGSPMALVNNIDSVNDDTLEGKIDEAAPKTVCMGSETSLHSDEGDMNSVMCPNTGKNFEDCGVVLTQNVEERALDGLPISSLSFPDASGNMENLSMAFGHEVKEPGPAS